MKGFPSTRCFNPFGKANHCSAKTLRKIPDWVLEQFESAPKGGRICTSCNVAVCKLRPKPVALKRKNSEKSSGAEKRSKIASSVEYLSDLETSFQGADLEKTNSFFVAEDCIIGDLNRSLIDLGKSPIQPSKKSNKNYLRGKIS